jgi:hypothetical protein
LPGACVFAWLTDATSVEIIQRIWSSVVSFKDAL